jgi:hypothetical protein
MPSRPEKPPATSPPALLWADREAAGPAALARIQRLAEARRRPYVRTRPRNAEEAALLRAKGTPERLIGPAKAPRTPDAAVDQDDAP